MTEWQFEEEPANECLHVQIQPHQEEFNLANVPENRTVELRLPQSEEIVPEKILTIRGGDAYSGTLGIRGDLHHRHIPPRSRILA